LVDRREPREHPKESLDLTLEINIVIISSS